MLAVPLITLWLVVCLTPNYTLESQKYQQKMAMEMGVFVHNKTVLLVENTEELSYVVPRKSDIRIVVVDSTGRSESRTFEGVKARYVDSDDNGYHITVYGDDIYVSKKDYSGKMQIEPTQVWHSK